MTGRDITLSVVSHRQNRLLNQLLEDIGRFCADRATVLVTLNADDPEPLLASRMPGAVEVISNVRPKGFGANQNAAFARCQTPFFCVVNPDVRLTRNPFTPLLETALQQNVGAVAPLVRSPRGNIENSARHYPTLPLLFRRLFSSKRGLDYPTNSGPVDVDWVAGMFIVFRSDAFRAVGGFNERYFLYYEDVDICFRMRAAGHRVVYDTRTEVIHDAQRASRRNPRLALHHIASATRFLTRGG
jgi:GT2 family glycosyltransferase